MNDPVAIIGGSGPGLGAGLAKTFARNGFQVAEISRSGSQAHGVNSLAVQCDLSDINEAKRAINQIVEQLGPPQVYIHNAALLHVARFLETEPGDFESVWRTSVLTAVNGTKAVIPYMLSQQSGTILFAGATAAIRGGRNFSAFSSAKFALRGLAQSLAREFQYQGLHVAHVILDGLMRGTSSVERFGGTEETAIDPLAAAESFLAIVRQSKSAWTHEIDLRPFSERF